MKKIQNFLAPDVINAYRIWPRAMITLYGWIVYDSVVWFKALEDPSEPQVAFALGILGAAGVFFGFYVKSGPDVSDVHLANMRLYGEKEEK